MSKDEENLKNEINRMKADAFDTIKQIQKLQLKTDQLQNLLKQMNQKIISAETRLTQLLNKQSEGEKKKDVQQSN